jgi:Uma2 family endonuclease
MTAPRLVSASTLPLHEYLIEEDEMGDSAAQSTLLYYLVGVLRWLYHSTGWFVAPNLTFYHRAIQNSQEMIAPDIAVFIGIPLSADERWELTSWDMRRGDKACPPVVLEVSSEGTWKSDLGPGRAHKPALYGAIGVREYFAYDPNPRQVWRGPDRRRLVGQRLRGWRYGADGTPEPLPLDARGWLWSAALESWLVPDEALLRLVDRQGTPRLTQEEAESEARLQAEERLAAPMRALREHNIDPDSL